MKRWFLYLVIFFSVGASADPLQDLYRQASRPTIRQLAEVTGGFRGPNPFPNHFMTKPISSDEIAELLVRVEWIYPNAIFATLGRDAVSLGDAFEAFWWGQGVRDRVTRLELSGPSFQTSNLQPIVEYLATKGAPIRGRTGRPFVIFDRTSFGFQNGSASSQSSIIAQMVATGYIGAGGDPASLIREFGILTCAIVQGATLGSAPANDAALEDYFTRQQQSLVKHRIFFEPLAFPTALVDSTFWHGPYGPLKDGRTPTLGSAFDEPYRAAVLFELFELGRIMTDPSFLKHLESRAAKYGYRFADRLAAAAPPLATATATRRSPAEEFLLKPREQQLSFLRDASRQGLWNPVAALLTHPGITYEQLTRDFLEIGDLASWLQFLTGHLPTHPSASEIPLRIFDVLVKFVREQRQPDLGRDLLATWRAKVDVRTPQLASSYLSAIEHLRRQEQVLRGRDARALVEELLFSLDPTTHAPTVRAVITQASGSKYIRDRILRAAERHPDLTGLRSFSAAICNFPLTSPESGS